MRYLGTDGVLPAASASHPCTTLHASANVPTGATGALDSRRGVVFRGLSSEEKHGRELNDNTSGQDNSTSINAGNLRRGSNV